MNWNEISKLYETDEDFMYENAILVFDTSSLLELYFTAQIRRLKFLKM